MVKKKNNNIIIIPKSLTLKEAAIRLEVNAIKVKLLDENVWADFSKNILLKKNKTDWYKSISVAPKRLLNIW